MPRWNTDAIVEALQTGLEDHATEIYDTVYEREDQFVRSRRIKSKIKRFVPGAKARAMLHYIDLKGGLSYYESFGLNWNILRVLMTRGLVTWTNDRLVINNRSA